MSKLKLTDVEWGEFFIGGSNGLFDITSTKSGIDKNKLNIDVGLIPYITRTDMQNGINMFITDKQNNRYNIDEGNVITIGLDTQTVFYQPTAFYTGQNIQVLRNNKLNKYTAMFIIPSIKIQMQKFNWGGNGATLGRLNRTRLILPINSQGQPNWQFMEDYIKQEQKQQVQKIIAYYERKLVELAGDVVGLDKVEWKTFRFTEVFQEIQRGKRLTKANQTDGPKPYISSTSENNGVDAFIGNEIGVRKFEDVLTIANSGSVGSTFYQQFEFVASDHVTALKSENVDKYAYLFLSTVVKRLEEKYSFNREINDTRIKREKVILPADKQGNPNFQYMSDFVKKLELDKAQEVFKYIYIYIYQSEEHS